jgi:hypothetical protein
MPNVKNIEKTVDDTIDELAERLKKATDSLAAEAHEVKQLTIAKLRAASAKLEQLATKLETSVRS